MFVPVLSRAISSVKVDSGRIREVPEIGQQIGETLLRRLEQRSFSATLGDLMRCRGL